MTEKRVMQQSWAEAKQDKINSKCKVPEARTSLACSRKKCKTNVAREE